ncbi:aromatic-L-amino-acid decarboxylase [Angomonas deanei]|uniref:Pyridoxal-dependent decarboxylase conserved domain containing protein, putative n=1 Tax=Angomonas deanei TaxID=59799 RepID=A0A7G2CGM4_9TRYP|nr:aromatic-L-amino-acid decarboxylase [Angomonas deanei]CAD2218024.1 Pyridoxal-dependent decarboxylase conserved domain containing protein, putative [Angomonas deanei]|eukprot:EPY40520.1 aromatic-L-amino-acid decarboxylase [Angomonas deanei]
MRPVCPPLPDIPKAMDWEKFRSDGHKMIDFIADYYKSLSENKFPPQSAVQPGYLKKAIVETEAPLEPQQDFSGVLADIQKHIVPGMTHWQHKNFYAWFPAQLSPPALLGDTIASSLNQPGFNWMASPAASELEVIVTNWMSGAFGLPADMTWEGTGGGVLQPSATEAASVVVLAAKNRSLSRFSTLEEKGAAASKLVAYVSDQAHFCTEKACRILSIFHVRKIKTYRREDGNYPMSAAELEKVMAEDVKNGLIPCFLGVNYGTTGICAWDDFADIAALPLVKEYHVWINLDAAYAGAVALCPELRDPLLPAFDVVDSLWVNGSKWFSLMTNCTFQFFRDRHYIVQSLNATGIYLANKHTEADAVVDFKDYHLGMGRPFRALKVYTTLQMMGVDGIRATVRRHCTLAKYLHDLLSNDPIFELPLPPKFGLVCVRLAGDEDNSKTRKLLQKLEEDRTYMVVSHELEGKVIIRIALAHPQLTQTDMEEMADFLSQQAKQV